MSCSIFPSLPSPLSLYQNSYCLCCFSVCWTRKTDTRLFCGVYDGRNNGWRCIVSDRGRRALCAVVCISRCAVVLAKTKNLTTTKRNVYGTKETQRVSIWNWKKEDINYWEWHSATDSSIVSCGDCVCVCLVMSQYNELCEQAEV